ARSRHDGVPRPPAPRPVPLALLLRGMRPGMSRSLRAAALLIAACCASARAASTIAIATGTATPIGVLSGLSHPALGGHGGSECLGTSSALFAASSPPTRILTAGDALPDGGSVASMGPPAVAPGGCVVLRVAGVNVDGILRRCGGTLSWLVRRGDPAPDAH